MSAIALKGDVQRVVILKADGLPGGLVEQMLSEREPATGDSQLPWIERVFQRRGVWVRHFYSRGVSLSVPSWSILDTGRPMAIRGNVEYDRYTLRAFDYLNFFPFYFKSAFSKAADMPAVELLDDLGIPLLSDRFRPEETHQSFQLYQRGIRWNTLKQAARGPFPLASPRQLIDEWQGGFELSRSLQDEMERNLISALSDERIRYLDLFTGDFDHLAHLDNNEKAQRAVVSRIDRLVGRIWTAIENSPLAAHTLLVLVSDHGINTSPDIYSQGYNLVEFLRSIEGGAHHVVTNRHPLSEYKLRGLYPFVDRVFTASASSPFGSGSHKQYPTVLLDLDGNERAAIYVRNSDLNLIHLLLLQLDRRDLAPAVRAAAEQECRRVMERYAERSRSRTERLKRELDGLRMQLADVRSGITTAQGSIERQRMKARARSWTADDRAYRNSIAVLDRLFAATPGLTHASSTMVPERLIGEPNTIHQMQNYVVSVAAEGLQLNPDGTLDEARSLKRLNYFRLLTALSVRNVVQEGVGDRPIDFVAVRLRASDLSAALPDEDAADVGVWLYGGDDRQLVLLAREPDQLKVLPVARLREEADGRITFENRKWSVGLPLGLLEDDHFAVGAEDREQWLSKWHTEREWLQASHRGRYSNAVIGLVEQFRGTGTERSREGFHWARRELVEPELLVFANDHWNFNVRGFNPGGNHGSFFRMSSRALLMMVGGSATGVGRGVSVDAPYDTLSFAPTVLALMGRCEPDLPGPYIREAKEVTCAPTPE